MPTIELGYPSIEKKLESRERFQKLGLEDEDQNEYSEAEIVSMNHDELSNSYRCKIMNADTKNSESLPES